MKNPQPVVIIHGALLCRPDARGFESKRKKKKKDHWSRLKNRVRHARRNCNAVGVGPAGYFNTARWCSMGVQWGEGRREQSEISTGSDRQSAASRNTNRQLPAHVLEETRREQNLEVSGKLPLEEGPFVVIQKKPSTCRGKSRLMIPGPMGMKAFTSRCLIHRCISRR